MLHNKLLFDNSCYNRYTGLICYETPIYCRGCHRSIADRAPPQRCSDSLDVARLAVRSSRDRRDMLTRRQHDVTFWRLRVPLFTAAYPNSRQFYSRRDWTNQADRITRLIRTSRLTLDDSV